MMILELTFTACIFQAAQALPTTQTVLGYPYCPLPRSGTVPMLVSPPLVARFHNGAISLVTTSI